MDITAFDITILVASTIGIILMSFTFPALGLTGEATTADEIPEFEITSDRFDFSGEFPTLPDEGPGHGRSGTIYVNEPTEPSSAFILGDESHGWQLETYNGTTDGTRDLAYVQMWHWHEGDRETIPELSEEIDGRDLVFLENENDTEILYSGNADINWGNITVNATAVNMTGQDTGNFQAEIGYSYDCEECGEGSSGAFEGLPFIGGLFEAGNNVAAGVVWIAEIIVWIATVGLELTINGLSVMVEMLAFMFGLADFLVTTYTEVVSAEGLAPWASVILVIPGIMLMAVWAKLAAVAVEVIWIG